MTFFVAFKRGKILFKLELTGQNPGRVFNSRWGRVCICHAIVLITKTAQLKVENSARKVLGCLPLAFAHNSSYLS